MRPLVTQGQKLPPGAPRSAHPRNRAELAAFRTALRLAATPLVGRLSGLAGAFTRPPAEAIALPDYPIAATRALAA